MTPTIPQLCLLRCFLRKPVSVSLVEVFLRRCGATQEEWEELVGKGYLSEEGSEVFLTHSGRKFYNKSKIGRYF